MSRNEFIFAPPGLGINQQSGARPDRPAERDLAVYRSADIPRDAIQGLYTYDAFSPLVLFVLERFGFCAPGEAAAWVQDGRIGPGGALPVNTSGGLLSEAHVAGWNSLCEMVHQLRGEAGPRQIAGARALQWATAWGDSVILAELRGRTQLMSGYEKPTPRINPDNARFWESAHEGAAPPAPLRGLPSVALAAGPGLPDLLLRADRLGGGEGSRHGLHLDRGPQGLVPRIQGRYSLYRGADRACGRRAVDREHRRVPGGCPSRRASRRGRVRPRDGGAYAAAFSAAPGLSGPPNEGGSLGQHRERARGRLPPHPP